MESNLSFLNNLQNNDNQDDCILDDRHEILSPIEDGLLKKVSVKKRLSREVSDKMITGNLDVIKERNDVNSNEYLNDLKNVNSRNQNPMQVDIELNNQEQRKQKNDSSANFMIKSKNFIEKKGKELIRRLSDKKDFDNFANKNQQNNKANQEENSPKISHPENNIKNQTPF